jgi:hypothetical protein
MESNKAVCYLLDINDDNKLSVGFYKFVSKHGRSRGRIEKSIKSFFKFSICSNDKMTCFNVGEIK